MKAAFLGRFQPLHKGHLQVIENYRERYDSLELVIGSADISRTEENPLTAEEREEVIRGCFPDIDILYLEDESRDSEGDKLWAEKLEDKIDASLLLTRNELVKELMEEKTGIKVEEQEMYDEDLYSGTEVRRRMRSGEEWRYLVPGCSKEKLEELADKVKKSGKQYEFEPGWKRENAYHGTAEDD